MKIASVLSELVDRGETDVRELCQVTGRGSSTVFRWIHGDSEPGLEEARLLARGLGDVAARHRIVSALTLDLPVVLSWVEREPSFTVLDSDGASHDGHELLARTLLALECITHSLRMENDVMRAGELSVETFLELAEQLDNAVSNLMASKDLLERFAEARRRRGA